MTKERFCDFPGCELGTYLVDPAQDWVKKAFRVGETGWGMSMIYRRKWRFGRRTYMICDQHGNTKVAATIRREEEE